VQIDALPNLSIPDIVGNQVIEARQHTAGALASADVGNYEAAMMSARRARTVIEMAASHPAIISQHNYPQQHLIAIYLPLFAPLSLPIIAAVFVEMRHAASKLRALRQR
jgi:GPI-anchor transamidase subunit S